MPPLQADGLLKGDGITRDNVELARYSMMGCASLIMTRLKFQRLGQSFSWGLRGVPPSAPHGSQAGAPTQEDRLQEWNQVRVV